MAHEYVRQNCLDLGLNYLGGLSADMDDLLLEKGRADADVFWDYTLYYAKNGLHDPLPAWGPAAKEYVPSLAEEAKQGGYDTVIVTNCEPQDNALAAMIADFVRVYPYPARVINIAEYPFSGGCLGCFGCAADGKCVYKDGFDSFLRQQIQTADAIVYAFTIKDHSMGATFKRYDDRQLCNGYRTVMMGMPMGYIINGDYAREANLRMIIEGRCEVGQNFLAGCAVDAAGLAQLSAKLCYTMERHYAPPQTSSGWAA